jgi:signal transduction histidine kinase
MSQPTGREIAFDVGVAAAFAAVAFLEASGHADGGFRGAASPVLSGLAAAVAPLPLAARRFRPLTSTASVALLATMPHLVISFDVILIGGLFAVAVALEGAARYGHRPRHRLALLFPLPPLLLFSAMVPGFLGQTVVYVVILGVGWTVGILFRALVERRQALSGLLEARQAMQELETERAVLAERAGIARELHDVIAHCVSVMVLQAGAARLLLEVDPGRSAKSVDLIESTGREALLELRRVLGVLQAGPAIEPFASLARLDRLTERVRAAGLDVAVAVDGDVSSLPSGLDLSLYRIVQESLTNALKHGSDARADLRLAVAGGHVEIVVLNAAVGPGRVALPGGNGQTGMQERVAAFGGALSTGFEQGRYRVHAVVPVEAVAR